MAGVSVLRPVRHRPDGPRSPRPFGLLELDGEADFDVAGELGVLACFDGVKNHALRGGRRQEGETAGNGEIGKTGEKADRETRLT